MIERFKILRILLAVMSRETTKLCRNQAAAPRRLFQKERRAQPRHRADPSAVKTLVPDQLRYLICRAVKLRQVEQIVRSLRHDDFQTELIRRFGKGIGLLKLPDLC